MQFVNKNFFINVFSISVILIALKSTQPATAQDESTTWDLENCIDHAWNNNLQLQQQKLSVDLARENLSQNKASRYPSLNASASHAYNFGRTVDPFTNQFATESVQSNNFSVNSGMSLFGGFQITNSIKESEMELEATRYDLEKTYNDIALSVASAYLQVLFAEELVNNARNQLEISNQQVERTQKLVDAGTLPRGSLLTIEAQQATEELQLVNAQNQLDLAYLSLRQILFLPEDQDFRIDSPELEIDPQQDPDQSPLEVYQTAVNQQPEIKSADLRISGAEKSLMVAKGGRSPNLSMRASYGTGYSGASLEVTDVVQLDEPVPIGMTESGEVVFGPDFETQTRVKPFSDQLSDNLNRSIGFFLTIPVFNNLQTKSTISRSKINLENAKLQSKIVREQLFQTIQQAHADATAALKRFTSTDKNVQALEESFRYTEQRFNVGLVNSVEYNDAKNRLNAAESERLQAKYEYIFRMKILDFYLGNPLRL
ncbi:MAG: TolC family protein [Bacteroidota bacterium]